MSIDYETFGPTLDRDGQILKRWAALVPPPATPAREEMADVLAIGADAARNVVPLFPVFPRRRPYGAETPLAAGR